MKLGLRLTRMLATGVTAILLAVSLTSGTALAQPADGRGRGFGGFIQSTDPRVQNRTYHFADTNVDLPYCVFVSSKVSKDTKSPLIVSLHGLGIGPGFMCRGRALDLAEEGGYILVAPMGYDVGGWYGSPVMKLRSRAGQPAPPPPPDNLAELSEKDVQNVLSMMRREFNVDDNRTYLMGHSMGGAGTLFLGSKHPTEWAAIAAMAPAAFLMNDTRTTMLQHIKDAGLPVIVTQGDEDTAVPVSNTRMWIDTMKERGLNYQYKEIAGADHGSVIDQGMPDIFAFFKDHPKSARAQQAATGAAPVGRGAQPPDPRVQQRSYHFTDTNEDIPYAVFASSKVTKDKKSPLIIALHGLGGSPNSLMRGNLLDLAEQGGFVVFAPMGYNPRGWYGIPGNPPPTPGVTPRPPDPAAATDPPNLRELSERDVMNLLAMARKEFNVDERRTYLMGHSMGGAGTLYLASKHAQNWAAIAAIAPAARRMEADMPAVLSKITMPVIVIQGDADTAVPVANTRKWIAAMKDAKMDYKYSEIPGGDHGSVISTGMPDIFAFFNAHTKH